MDHCFHDTGVVLTSDPPQYQERCCWCGVTRLKVPKCERMTGHGQYAPSVQGSPCKFDYFGGEGECRGGSHRRDNAP